MIGVLRLPILIQKSVATNANIIIHFGGLRLPPFYNKNGLFSFCLFSVLAPSRIRSAICCAAVH
jgi:hypothetical protein